MPEGCQGYEAVTGWMNHGTWGMLGFRKVTRGGVHGFRRVSVCGVRVSGVTIGSLVSDHGL